jgi:hypothetical protein
MKIERKGSALVFYFVSQSISTSEHVCFRHILNSSWLPLRRNPYLL